MSNEEQVLLMIKGSIAELPEPEQTKCKLVAGQLRDIINKEGGLGLLALALVGAEKQLAAS